MINSSKTFALIVLILMIYVTSFLKQRFYGFLLPQVLFKNENIMYSMCVGTDSKDVTVYKYTKYIRQRITR